jgi:hypothetical protein
MRTSNKKFEETVLKGRLNVVYTVLRTYTRCDGEPMARCAAIANNITVSGGIITNYLGFKDVSLNYVQENFKEIY